MTKRHHLTETGGFLQGIILSESRMKKETTYQKS
jgi:hypothetical protein